jgi:hypothetical protein
MADPGARPNSRAGFINAVMSQRNEREPRMAPSMDVVDRPLAERLAISRCVIDFARMAFGLPCSLMLNFVHEGA